MLIDEFLCKREFLGKRAPHSFTPPLSVVGVSNIVIVIKTLSMEGKNYQIGNDYGQIWCKSSSGGTPEMDLHQNMMMKRIVL